MCIEYVNEPGNHTGTKCKGEYQIHAIQEENNSYKMKRTNLFNPFFCKSRSPLKHPYLDKQLNLGFVFTSIHYEI